MPKHGRNRQQRRRSTRRRPRGPAYKVDLQSFAQSLRNPYFPFSGPKPAMTVKFIVVVNFDTSNFATGYFDTAYTVKVANLIDNSAYKDVIRSFQKIRVRSYHVMIYNTGSSANTPGRAAAHIFRDGVKFTSPRYYEQLLVEPGHKDGKLTTKLQLKWVPIEPSDLEYVDLTNATTLNSGTYGTIMYSGLTTGLTDTKNFLPIGVFTFTVDLLNLANPPVPPKIPLPGGMCVVESRDQLSADEFQIVQPNARGSSTGVFSFFSSKSQQ